MKKCPKCKKEYKEHSAISRVDNATEICSLCGAVEAITMANEFIEKKRYDIRVDSLCKEERDVLRMLTTDIHKK